MALARGSDRQPGRQRTAQSGSRTDVAHRVARRIAGSTWAERSVRVGLGTRAVVYLVLAYLVARIAGGLLAEGVPGRGAPDKAASGPGVAQAIAARIGGRVALIAFAVGLFLFALFSVVDAVSHHDDEHPAAKRWGDRALSLWGFVLYSAFGAYSLRTALSAQTGQHSAARADRRQAQWSARVLGWPGGPAWLGLLGAVLVVIAIFLVTRCLRVTFRPRFEGAAMSRRMWRVTLVTGIAGYLARAEMFAIVGWFVLSAALENDPRRGQGVDGSARRLAASGLGPYLLWPLALGLAAYALFTLVEARYRAV